MTQNAQSPAPSASPRAAPDSIPSAVDVLVVGGGAAGLNGALVLARARRSVLVVDSGTPRNAPAAGVHGFLTCDGMPPAEFIAAGRSEVESYGGTVVDGEVVGARRQGDRFVVTLADGRRLGARRLLVTTGLADELPNIPGVSERWGRDVLHCPYCHGWELRDQPVGIVASSAMAMHQVLLFRQMTADLTLFLNDAFEPSDDDWEKLAARGVAVIDGAVTGLEVADDHLAGVQLASGAVIPVRAAVVAPHFRARSTILVQLGLTPTPHPMGMGEYIASGAMGVTDVAGVWVAGNVTDLSAQAIVSAAGGMSAGASINADLVMEETDRAVEDRREPFSAAAEARNTERVLGNRRHGL